MQNIDFYSGHSHGHNQPDFMAHDPEYFSRMAKNQAKEGTKKRNRATRLLSIVMGLMIVSFTSGLVVGIKFTGGGETEIVDSQTKSAMSNIGTRVGDLVKDGSDPSEGGAADSAESGDALKSVAADQKEQASESGTKAKSFPKAEYPYVIKIGNRFTEKNAKDIAEYLSVKGHTVILSKNEGFFRVYVDPSKTKQKAEAVWNRINYYTDNKYFHNATVLKR